MNLTLLPKTTKMKTAAELPSMPVREFLREIRKLPEEEKQAVMQATMIWDGPTALGYVSHALLNAGIYEKRIEEILNLMKITMVYMDPQKAAETAMEYDIPAGDRGICRGGQSVAAFLQQTMEDGDLEDMLDSYYTWSYAAIAGYVIDTLQFENYTQEKMVKILFSLQTSISMMTMPEALQQYFPML